MNGFISFSQEEASQLFLVFFLSHEAENSSYLFSFHVQIYFWKTICNNYKT